MYQLQEKNAGEGMCRWVWGLYWGKKWRWSDNDPKNWLPGIIKKTKVSLDEMEEKLLESENISITYNSSLSKLVSIRSTCRAWPFSEDSKTLRVKDYVVDNLIFVSVTDNSKTSLVLTLRV